jgi:hypothetical protein
MPWYFFHVLHRNSDKALDQEGVKLKDCESAQAEAILSLRELVADAIRQGSRATDLGIEIVDEGGEVLSVVNASEIIH